MNYPNQCYLELTQRCNLGCRHCFAEGSPDKAAQMSLDDVKDIYRQLEELGVIWINLSGGEPLLHPELFPIIEFASRQPYSTCLLTNGTLWDDDTVEAMARADPERHIHIQVSLDGPDYETTRRQRPMSPDEYRRSLRTLRRFKKMGFETGCLHVVSAVTVARSFETMRQALFDLDADSAQAVPLFPAGRAAQFRAELDNFWEGWAELVLALTDVKKGSTWGERTKRFNVGFFTLFELVLPLDQAGRHDDILDVWGLDVSSKEAFFRQTRRDFYCESGRTELAIGADLVLHPCVSSLRTSFRAGSLRERTLAELWREAEILEWFRSELGRVVERAPCRDCAYRDICGGGCRLTAYELTGDKYAPDPRCPVVAEHWRAEGVAS